MFAFDSRAPATFSASQKHVTFVDSDEQDSYSNYFHPRATRMRLHELDEIRRSRSPVKLYKKLLPIAHMSNVGSIFCGTNCFYRAVEHLLTHPISSTLVTSTLANTDTGHLLRPITTRDVFVSTEK